MESLSIILNSRKMTPLASKDAIRVLLVSHRWDIACDLPQVFVDGGIEVDVLCPAGNCAMKSGFHDGWWNSGPDQESLFQRLYKLMQTERYRKIIICDDPLLWQIAYQPINELMPLMPVQGAAIGITNKAGLSQFCQQAALLTPAFFVLNHESEIVQAAQKIGYPLLIKPNLSSGGMGIVVCQGSEEYESYWLRQPFSGHGYLIQQYVEGENISVEALFHHGYLLEYASSKTYSEEFLPSTRRIYQEKVAVLTQLLERFGEASRLDGFVNMTFRLSVDNNYWLFEADPRPNRWLIFGKWFAADFSKVIRQWLCEPPKARDFPCPAISIEIPVIENMPKYAQELINQGRLVDALLHLTDFDHTWRYLLADPVQLEGRLRSLHKAILAAKNAK